MKWRIFLGLFSVFGGILGVLVAVILIRDGWKTHSDWEPFFFLYGFLMLIQIRAGFQIVSEAKEMKEQ